MSGRLVTITTFRSAAEAHLARGALESAGIDAAIVNEYGHLEEHGPPLQLQVREEDAEDAEAIVNRMYHVAHAEFVQPSDEDEFAPPARCERCGSAKVQPVNKIVQFGASTALILLVFSYWRATVWSFYAIVIVGVLILLRGRWWCPRCGYRWT